MPWTACKAGGLFVPAGLQLAQAPITLLVSACHPELPPVDIALATMTIKHQHTYMRR